MPTEFENDAGGGKRAWRAAARAKLEDAVARGSERRFHGVWALFESPGGAAASLAASPARAARAAGGVFPDKSASDDRAGGVGASAATAPASARADPAAATNPLLMAIAATKRKFPKNH